jgi:hypothetical protein
MGDPHGREDFVSVEPRSFGIHVRGERPRVLSVTVVIPWDQAVEVSRRILRSIWDASSHPKRLRLIALLILTVLVLMIGGHLAGETLPLGN